MNPGRLDLVLVADIDARLAEIVEQRRNLRQQVDAEHRRADDQHRVWQEATAAAVTAGKKLPAKPADADVEALAVALNAVNAEEARLRQERDQRLIDHADEIEAAANAAWSALVDENAPRIRAIVEVAEVVAGLASALKRVRGLEDKSGPPLPLEHRRAQRTRPVKSITAPEIVRMILANESVCDLAPIIGQPRTTPVFLDNTSWTPLVEDQEPKPPPPIVGGARL